MKRIALAAGVVGIIAASAIGYALATRYQFHVIAQGLGVIKTDRLTGRVWAIGPKITREYGKPDPPPHDWLDDVVNPPSIYSDIPKGAKVESVPQEVDIPGVGPVFFPSSLSKEQMEKASAAVYKAISTDKSAWTLTIPSRTGLPESSHK